MPSGRGTEAPRPYDETISLPPRSRPEMNPCYQRPRIKQRGFELFCNDQSCKRSDLRIRRGASAVLASVAWDQGHKKKPAGVTPSAFSCDCRLEVRFRRCLTPNLHRLG